MCVCGCVCGVGEVCVCGRGEEVEVVANRVQFHSSMHFSKFVILGKSWGRGLLFHPLFVSSLMSLSCASGPFGFCSIVCSTPWFLFLVSLCGPCVSTAAKACAPMRWHHSMKQGSGKKVIKRGPPSTEKWSCLDSEPTWQR